MCKKVWILITGDWFGQIVSTEDVGKVQDPGKEHEKNMHLSTVSMLY